ncbi:sugar phosphate isomerase/epimerase family protein [Stratiformator vulcanicus]|uniref:Xylose isomerase-like TIM barrel n=1 Tax=Stratiformator vulcanicus TaxID=2527980 RepID=A0A517R3X0_9PLAN|nr:sugar phosphate isomerase/epimerase family protein [Stratiformator vulcanicus]QDT38588.1 Xylose isomerase-like TIM barrel [Stratiformator vulcanicus]
MNSGSQPLLERRNFLAAAAAAGTVALAGNSFADHHSKDAHRPFKISLAEWSLVSLLKGGELDNLDFPKVAKEEFGIDAVEWVNQFFIDKGKDTAYLNQMKTRCDDLGVKSVLIMIDQEGSIGEPDPSDRRKVVEKHFKWVEAAKLLGCHSIRVNAYSKGTFLEQMQYVSDGLRQLCEFADEHDINVIVENHGGNSSNAAWLCAVMELTDHPRVGTLPDFGNFKLGNGKQYDRYKGVMQMMPYAKGVSAKSTRFNDQGEDIDTDYRRMLGIVTGWGYDGYVGIEFGGGNHPKKEGIRLTLELLKKVRSEYSA